MDALIHVESTLEGVIAVLDAMRETNGAPELRACIAALRWAVERLAEVGA